MNNKLASEFNLDDLAQSVVGQSSSTVERLYNAVSFLVSSDFTLNQRLEGALVIIAPLLVDDFKEQNKDKFIQLNEELSNLQRLNHEQLKNVSQKILNLCLSELGIENPYIPIEEYKALQEIALKTNQPQENILRKAIALIKLAVNAEKSGYKVAITKGEQEIVTEIVGL